MERASLAEEERTARAARRAGQSACNALGAAARLAGRRGAAGGDEKLCQLARDLRCEARDLADCIHHLPSPTRRANRRAARARMSLARREARLARRHARRTRLACEDVHARLRALLWRERGVRAQEGRVGAGARCRGRREGARLARATAGVTAAQAARAEERAALCALEAALEARAGFVAEMGELEPAAAEDRDGAAQALPRDSEGAAPGQVPRPAAPALARALLPMRLNRAAC